MFIESRFMHVSFFGALKDHVYGMFSLFQGRAPLLGCLEGVMFENEICQGPKDPTISKT